MPEDWFRKTSWTKEDSDDFFAHLKRARPYNRSQYLRIQASYLAGVGTNELTQRALALLEILFVDYPDRLEMACAYLQKGECLSWLGNINDAVEFFKKSIDFQRQFPNVQNQAVIIFGLTAIENKLRAEYETVLNLLDEFEEDLSEFPVDRFRVFGIRAVIAQELGDRNSAASFAKQALLEAKKEHSGFWKHTKMGLVGENDRALRERLERMIGMRGDHGH